MRIVISIDKPELTEVDRIGEIMSAWTEKEEVDKYLDRIKNEINGQTEYNLQFWAARDDGRTVGIIGVCDPLPKIVPFATTKKPGELKVLYLDKNCRGKGIGRELTRFIEDEAARQGYEELLIRSAERYRETAYGFYEKMGYQKAGTVSGETETELMQVFEKKLI